MRMIRGFENYDEIYNCLQALLPATGTADAPRAFTLKLSRVLQDCGYVPTKAEPELMVKFDKGTLVGVLAKHSDDVHMGATAKESEATIAVVEAVFGTLLKSVREFTSVGVTHIQHKDGTVELHQDKYISALKPITGPVITGRPSEEAAGEELQFAFRCVLG